MRGKQTILNNKQYAKRFLFLSFVLSLTLFMGVQSVHAQTATLRLYDGTTTLNILDGDGNDANTAAGVVQYSGDFGVFDINVTTGLTKPALGSATSPELDLNQVTITCLWDLGCTGGTYTLITMFSDIGFGSVSPTAITTVGGTSDYQTSFNSYFDNSNNLFATTTLLGSLGTYEAATNDAPFSNSGPTTASSSFSPTGYYSLTSVATVTHNAAGQNTSFNMSVNVVPGPISSTLFIIGGATLGFRRFRKKIKSI